MSKSDATQASQITNYQDDVNADVDREYDLDATAHEDVVDDEEIIASVEPVDLVKSAVQKVCFFSSQKQPNFY